MSHFDWRFIACTKKLIKKSKVIGQKNVIRICALFKAKKCSSFLQFSRLFGATEKFSTKKSILKWFLGQFFSFSKRIVLVNWMRPMFYRKKTEIWMTALSRSDGPIRPRPVHYHSTRIWFMGVRASSVHLIATVQYCALIAQQPRFNFFFHVQEDWMPSSGRTLSSV